MRRTIYAEGRVTQQKLEKPIGGTGDIKEFIQSKVEVFEKNSDGSFVSGIINIPAHVKLNNRVIVTLEFFEETE